MAETFREFYVRRNRRQFPDLGQHMLADTLADWMEELAKRVPEQPRVSLPTLTGPIEIKIPAGWGYRFDGSILRTFPLEQPPSTDWADEMAKQAPEPAAQRPLTEEEMKLFKRPATEDSF